MVLESFNFNLSSLHFPPSLIGDPIMITNKAAYGIYPRHVQLPEIACSLKQAGFDNEDICMVVSPAHPVAKIVRDASVLERESSAVSARIIGWVSELGAVVIPSVGLFIRSQAFFRALVVDQEFQSFCGQSRTLAGLGFSEGEAERLDHQLCNDEEALVYVNCQESSRTDRALELMKSMGARETAALGLAHAVGAA
jgi:hypothetical protein